MECFPRGVQSRRGTETCESNQRNAQEAQVLKNVTADNQPSGRKCYLVLVLARSAALPPALTTLAARCNDTNGNNFYLEAGGRQGTIRPAQKRAKSSPRPTLAR